MEIKKTNQINNIKVNSDAIYNKFKSFQQKSSNAERTEIDLNKSSSVSYYKGLLSQPYKTIDILKMLEAHGYKRCENGYAMPFSEQQEQQVLFELYPNAKEGYEKDVTFKEFVDKTLQDDNLYKHFFKLAYTIKNVCKESLTLSDISDLNEFANLGNGKIGKYLESDFDYTLFVFKLMKHNNIYERFIEQLQKQPTLLDSLLQLLENKPDVETIKYLNNYKSLNAFAINASLIKLSKDNTYQIDDDITDAIKNIDKYMENFEIKQPIKILRSDHPSIMMSLTNPKAKILFDKLFEAQQSKNYKMVDELCDEIKSGNFDLAIKGYLSSSLDYNMDRNILWDLTVHSGVKAVPLDLINVLSQDTADENEVLVQRNTRLEIEDIKLSDNGQFVIKADVYPL